MLLSHHPNSYVPLLILLTHLSDLCVGKVRERAFLSWNRGGIGFGGAAFCIHILHVVGLRSKPKMLGVATGRIVALVTDFQLLWKGAVVDFIAHAVRFARATASMDNAVPVRVARALPFPTFVWAALIHILPKVFFDRARWVQSSVMPNGKANGQTLYMPKFGIRSFRNWGKLTTATFAETARIWPVTARELSAMALHVTSWLSFDQSSPAIVMGGNRRETPTAAHAQATWVWPYRIELKFRLGWSWGMLHGVDFLLTGIGQARDAREALPGTSYWALLV